MQQLWTHEATLRVSLFISFIYFFFLEYVLQLKVKKIIFFYAVYIQGAPVVIFSLKCSVLSPVSLKPTPQKSKSALILLNRSSRHRLRCIALYAVLKRFGMMHKSLEALHACWRSCDHHSMWMHATHFQITGSLCDESNQTDSSEFVHKHNVHIVGHLQITTFKYAFFITLQQYSLPE